MSKKLKILGACHICGEYGFLSFEHIPPRSAFNNYPVTLAKIDDLLSGEDLDIVTGTKQQRGAGDYTLCPRCNNNTGTWYGPAFIDWTYQAALILSQTQGSPTLFYPYKIFPLRVIKQIICMFFSTNGERFREAQPELVKFVLDKNAKFIDPKINIYCFLNPSDRSRQTGIAGILDINSHTSKIISEIAFPPIGYVMTMHSASPDEKLFDISFFANYGYDEWKEFGFKLPVLPIYSPLPCDYSNRHVKLGN